MSNPTTSPFPTNRRTRTTLAFLVAGAFALASCGLDELAVSGTTTEPTSEPSPSVTEPSDPEPSSPTSGFGSTPSTGNEPATSSVTPSTIEAPPTLPNVVGQIDTRAEEALLAAGVTDIQVVEEPGLGEAGEVIKQQPPAGSAATGTVTLTVRGELPAMPDYVATSSEDAIEELESWGVETSVQTTIDETRPLGEVLATVPAAGAQIGQVVELTVSARPVTVSIGEQGALLVDEFYGFQWYRYDYAERFDGIVELNGEATVQALTITYEGSSEAEGDPTGTIPPTYLDYNLGRDWTTFRASVGLGDQSQAFAQGVFRVYVDGDLKAEHLLALGQTVDLEVDVTNALRLKLEVEPKIVSEAYYVWDNPVVVGAGAAS